MKACKMKIGEKRKMMIQTWITRVRQIDHKILEANMWGDRIM